MYTGIKLVHVSLLLVLVSITSLVQSQRAEAGEISNNLGLGFGIPYGILGVSYELEIDIFDSFSIGPSVAVGTTILDGAATEVGLQLHFGNRHNTVRFGISYWSGTNTIIETGFEEYTTEEGETAGINLRYQLDSSQGSALDFHVLKIQSPEEDEILRRFGGAAEGSDIKLGVGFIQRF